MLNRYLIELLFRKRTFTNEEKAKFRENFYAQKTPVGSAVSGLLLLAAFSFLSPLVYRLMAHLQDWGHLLALGGLVLSAFTCLWFCVKDEKWSTLQSQTKTPWSNSLQILTALLFQAIIAYLDLKFKLLGTGPAANLISIAILAAWAFICGNVTIYGMATLSIYNLIGLKVYTLAWLDLAWQPDVYLIEMGLLLSLLGSVIAWFKQIRQFPTPLIDSIRITHLHYLACCLGLMLMKTQFNWVYLTWSLLALVYWHRVAFRFESMYLLVVNCLLGYALTVAACLHYFNLIFPEVVRNFPILTPSLLLLVTLTFIGILFSQHKRMNQLKSTTDES